MEIDTSSLGTEIRESVKLALELLFPYLTEKKV
jgi:hypothetical protein